MNNDAAFVIFPHGTFSGHPMAKITESSVKAGDTVGLVGYGVTGFKAPNADPTNAESKRFCGSNTVAKIDDN
jgi:hypothetical protein